MKKILVFISCLLFLSCNQDEQNGLNDLNTVPACSCEQPTKELPWLKELIKKAESDKTGNCWGTIWLVNYNGKDMFVTDMALGSGGILHWIFDCSGNHYAGAGSSETCPADNYVGKHHFEPEEVALPPLHELKLDVVIYSNLPL